MLKLIVDFAHFLNKSGFEISTKDQLMACEACSVLDISQINNIYFALKFSFLKNQTNSEIFNQAFQLFINKQQAKSNVDNNKNPKQSLDSNKKNTRRLNHAASNKNNTKTSSKVENIELAYSRRKSLQAKDFNDLSESEYLEVIEMVKKLSFYYPKIKIRRYQLTKYKTHKLKWHFKPSLLQENFDFYSQKKTKQQVTALLDISGSMNAYTRILLIFLQKLLMQNPNQNQVLLFATKLTDITTSLNSHDVDNALKRVTKICKDWSSGTKIAQALKTYNDKHTNKINNGIFILITDGIDQDLGLNLVEQLKRVRLKFKKIIWINPLMSYNKYQALTKGAKIIDTFSDNKISGHNIVSIKKLPKMFV